MEQESALAHKFSNTVFLLLFQGFLLLQLGGHRSQTAAAETQRQQDPHRGLGQSPEKPPYLDCIEWDC